MKKLLFFLFIFYSTYSLYPQGLNSVYSPDKINIIATGNNGRILKSTNNGSTYSLYNINPLINFTDITFSDSTYFFSASDGNIYKLYKSDITPNIINTGAGNSLNSITFLNSQIGFACGDSGVVLKTINSGINWFTSNNGIGNANLNSISFKDSLNGITVGKNGKIFITTNGGVNWVIQPLITSRNLLSAQYFNEGIIILGEYGTILKKIQNGNFILVYSNTSSDIRSISGTFSNNHICGGGGFIRNNFISENYRKFEENPMLAEISDIYFADSLNGYAVSNQNNVIIQTSNGGKNWSLPPNTTVNISWVSKLSASNGIGNNLCLHPSDRNTVFVMYGNIIYISRDQGDNWTQIASTSLGTRAHSFYVNPIDTNIWVAAIESSTDRIIRSTDYGVTWSTVLTQNFSNYGQPLEMDINNPSVFYFAPDGGGFYKSIDTGKTFTEISGNFPFLSPCDIMIMNDSANIIFVADGVTGSGLGKIFKSSNGGVNWSLVHTNSSSSEIPSMSNTVFDKSVMYATNWSGGNIYRSTNYGDNWALLRNNPSSEWASDICHEDPTVILTGSYGASTYLSTNSGDNFTSYSSGGGAGAGMIFPKRNYALNMMTSGLYKLNITYSILTEVLTASSHIPLSYSLYQNYPNPFNPVTKIKYDLPVSGFTKLTIYDNLGRIIKNLFNNFQNAGNYEIDFSGEELSSGIYFYRLESKDFIQTKKMILIK